MPSGNTIKISDDHFLLAIFLHSFCKFIENTTLNANKKKKSLEGRFNEYMSM